ncbi:hypothetical protein [Bacillus paralicheniformis]|uniref:hypothetical protein n=1 Tax=Bacillus paralicheniformis TaxID=1648923 RepID=UPI0007414C23|nr:hypothetical protein [Bacillus paralicheniformis]KUL15179.1 hypothetical protein LI6934_21365 [Bacillus licheniformis LMG 6934]MBG9883362.1 hypothetical protein [Bacillus paralicheniformis]MDE1393257.1 hypothetical protein [Bacillus paralicheniformis]MED0804295.1 hypothetical protein [Bacillus paralicheniformis]TAI53230.1 hypothetical protein CXP52_02835 [Bacillus paralicheniformis]
MELTITRALSELKMLDKRIKRAVNESTFGGLMIGKKLPNGFRTTEDLETRAKADYQSVEALIKRRNAIKSAIVVSNATTKIEVAGVKMTVAEAIERKTSISYDIQLLDKLKEVYADLVDEADSVNQKVTERLDKHLETLFGKDGKVKAAENQEIVKSFLAENEAKIIDPLNLKEKIDSLSKKIEDFEMEVDFALSESNTLTKINID